MRPPKDDLDQELPKVGVYGDDPPCDVYLNARLINNSPSFVLLGVGNAAAERYIDPPPNRLAKSIARRIELHPTAPGVRFQVVVNGKMLEMLRDDARFTP
jgi:hypothetical protein